MNYDEFEKLLEEISDEALDEYLDSLPDPEECHHTFSPEFERKMQKLIDNVGKKERRKRRRRRVLRIAAVVVVVLVVGFSATMLHPGARATVSRWVENVLPGWFTQEKVDQLPAEVPLGQYALTWVPEGYVECPDERFELDLQVGIIYRNSEKEKPVLFEYMKQRGIFIEQENMEVKTVDIHGTPATFYWDENAGIGCICWEDSKIGMFFSVSGALSEEELVRMAESVNSID